MRSLEEKYCKCGCGQKIKFKPRYEKYGWPDFLPKHVWGRRTFSMLMKRKKCN